MIDETGVGSEPKDGGNEQVPVASWVKATVDDLWEIDFEAPIVGLTTADADELSEHYQQALRTTENNISPADTPSNRVFSMLSAVAGF